MVESSSSASTVQEPLIEKTEENHVMLDENEKGDEELKNELETKIFELTLKQAKIDVPRDGLVAFNDLEEKKDQETDLDEERSGKVTESSSTNDYIVHEEVKGSESVEKNEKDQSDHSNEVQRILVSYPIRPDADDCTHYKKFGNCIFRSRCMFNHPPFSYPTTSSQLVVDIDEFRILVQVSAERVEQPECKYDMTPEGCKKRNCRYYHHGSDNSSMNQAAELNFLGLPIRLGEKECPNYMQTGLCKYRSKCRFHHPEPTTMGGVDSGYGNDNDSSLPTPPLIPSSSTISPSLSSPTRTAPPNKYWDGYQTQLPWSGQRTLSVKDRFLNTLKGILNHPDCNNLHLLNRGLIESAVTSADDLKDIASLILEKAVSEPTFCPKYGLLCAYVCRELDYYPSDEPRGRKITFKKVLIYNCQEVFENAGKLLEEIRQIKAPEQVQELRDQERLLKLQIIGIVRLMGEIMKYGLVPEKIVHHIVQELLGKEDKSCPAEENVEAMCHLCNTLGKQLDERGTSKGLNDKYFDRLKDFSTSPQLTARVRFMVLDVIDLRANNWIPRR